MSRRSPTIPKVAGARRQLDGWLPCLLIVIAAVLAYHNSLNGPFVFDDESSILKNSTIRDLWPPSHVLTPPGAGTTVSGRPILNLTFAVNYALGGYHVVGYHLCNLLIHAMAGLVLFGILRRTLATDRTQPNGAFTVSLASAVLWTVHPLQTEAVTYIAQRGESLMGLCYLLTLYCFIRGVDASDSRGALGRVPSSAGERGQGMRSNAWFALAVTSCAVGVATKEVAVTAPVVVLLYDRTFLARGLREAWRRHWPVYLGFVFTWIELAWLVQGAGSRGGTAGFSTGIHWMSYARYQVEAVAHYVWLAVWPHPLVFDYGNSVAVSVAGGIGCGIVLLAIFGATLVGLWRRNYSGFLGVWFFLTLAPSSSVVPIVTETMAEHRMYLALAAVVVGLMVFIRRVLGKWSGLLLTALSLIAIGATSARNEIYHSAKLLWSDTVAHRPDNAGAHNNLGSELLEAGEVPAAIEQFEQALRLDPRFQGAKSNLGVAYIRVGRLPEAISCFREILLVLPDYAEGRRNLGFALLRDRRPQEAIVELKAAVAVQAEDFESRRLLARSLMEAGRVAEAVPEYTLVVGHEPDNIEAQASLGDALYETGRVQEAIPHYESAVRLAPNFVMARLNLGNALLRSGRPSEAIVVLEAALQLQPRNALAMQNLAVALRAAGRIDEAKRASEQAEQLRATSH